MVCFCDIIITFEPVSRLQWQNGGMELGEAVALADILLTIVMEWCGLLAC